MYCLNMDAEISETAKPINAERLLRSLGASGRLVGFRYTVSIVEQLLHTPYERHWLTKCIYPETGNPSRTAADEQRISRHAGGVSAIQKLAWTRKKPSPQQRKT